MNICFSQLNDYYLALLAWCCCCPFYYIFIYIVVVIFLMFDYRLLLFIGVVLCVFLWVSANQISFRIIIYYSLTDWRTGCFHMQVSSVADTFVLTFFMPLYQNLNSCCGPLTLHSISVQNSLILLLLLTPFLPHKTKPTNIINSSYH